MTNSPKISSEQLHDVFLHLLAIIFQIFMVSIIFSQIVYSLCSKDHRLWILQRGKPTTSMQNLGYS